MKKYFFTGLVIILPLALTVIILAFVLDLLTEPFVGFVKALFTQYKAFLGPLYSHPKLLLFVGRLTVLVLMLMTIFVLGVLGRWFFFRYFHNKLNTLLERIPIIRRVYRLTREITKSVFGENKKPFGKPVMIPFPHPQSIALGFETGDAPEGMPEANMRSVFVPTSPHPISGFVLLTRSRDISTLPITPEEVLKFLVSCGTFQPGEKNVASAVDPCKNGTGKIDANRPGSK